MPAACRLSLRWHQQFCRSPSFTHHQQCLQRFQPLREYRQAVRARPPRSVQPQPSRDSTFPSRASSLHPQSDIVVREFEPDPYDSAKLRRIEPNEEITNEMAETRRELMQLDKELQIMRQGPFGPQSEFMQALPKDEREQLLQALAKEGVLPGEQEDLLTMAELDRMAEEDIDGSYDQLPRRLGVTLRIPKKDQAYIKHFNQALRAADERNGIDPQRNLNVWRWYLRCQQRVQNFSAVISDDVWQFLWSSQAELKVRPAHLVMLANDMLAAEKSLESDQWLAYIESLYASNDVVSAIRVFQEQKSHLCGTLESAKDYWNIGVKMYAATGQPLKAQELAFNALANDSADPQILVPVIIAWAQSQSSNALVKAWACYLKLREKAGDSMQITTYELISNAFLDTDHGDMALGVFKDMLLMKEASSHDSREVYKQATKHFGEILEHSTTEEHINHVGLSALLILPKPFQNRFFFTSWIKKLIGEKRIDSAAMVVELMFERGIAPDAKPLNGIIGAWLREGSISAQRKAENMAWSMIEARAAFVAQRSVTSQTQGQLYRKVLNNSDQSVRRKIPSATIETFSILLQHYTRRQDNARAEAVTGTMTDSCQIRPNSYIMNHWLFGDLRAGRLQTVWDKYINLKRDISPDLETFAALWDTAKAHLSRADPARAKDFPSTRELFAEMKGWTTTLTPNKTRRAQEDFSDELYEQIIRCFCFSADLPGTLLAMHHLARMFDVYPTDNALRLICGQAARLLPPPAGVRGGSSRSRRSAARHQSLLAQVADIVDAIESKRKLALLDSASDHGSDDAVIDPESLDDPTTPVARQLRLDVLTEFLCMFMQKAQAHAGSYRNDVKIAAGTMGVDLEGIELTFDD